MGGFGSCKFNIFWKFFVMFVVGKWFKIIRYSWGWFLEKIMWIFLIFKYILEKENLDGGWRDC